MDAPDIAPGSFMLSSASGATISWTARTLGSTLWFGHGRALAGTLLARRLTLFELIAPAIARHQQLERLQLLLNAHPYRVLCDWHTWFDLPPFAVHALTPIFRSHR
jgi:hypothetical protein